MADDPMNGVVDHAGRVFNGYLGGIDSGLGVPSVHEGFYVADGSIIPSAIAVNPLLTISALAERIAEGIALDPVHGDLFRPVA